MVNATQKERDLSDEDYEAVLDDIYGAVEICGMKFDSGRALRELDPTAFRCGKSDYESSLDEDQPIFVCGSCNEEFEQEDQAEECCAPAVVDHGAHDDRDQT